MAFMFTNKMKKRRLKCKLESGLEDSEGEQPKKGRTEQNGADFMKAKYFI